VELVAIPALARIEKSIDDVEIDDFRRRQLHLGLVEPTLT
jgi:hypothetical protein